MILNDLCSDLRIATHEMKTNGDLKILNKIINFGTYKGTKYISLSNSYVNWLLQQDLINDPKLLLAFRRLHRRQEIEAKIVALNNLQF